jgi:hypothetical protein
MAEDKRLLFIRGFNSHGSKITNGRLGQTFIAILRYVNDEKFGVDSFIVEVVLSQ